MKRLPLHTLGSQHFASQIANIRFGNKEHLESSIPVIDMALWPKGGSETAKNAFAKDFGKKLQKYGFIAIKNHGIDVSVFNTHFDELATLMNKDRKYLAQYQINEIARLSGYAPMGEKKPDGQGGYTAKDPKHMWQIQAPHYVYPLEHPAYGQANHKLFQEMSQLGDEIVDVLGRFLGDEDGVLKAFLKPRKYQASMMRAIHYPKLEPNERVGIRRITVDGKHHWVRTGEHRDLSLFTLLPEATASGLELLPNTTDNDTSNIAGTMKNSNKWLKVFAQDGMIIMNAGDQLRYMTDNLTTEDGESLEIPSTWHRVIGDKEQVKKDRYSVPFFYDANWLNPLINLATGQPFQPTADNDQDNFYKGVPFDPALKMLWARYAKDGTAGGMDYGTYERNYKDMGGTIKQVLGPRNLAAAYHSGAPVWG